MVSAIQPCRGKPKRSRQPKTPRVTENWHKAIDWRVLQAHAEFIARMITDEFAPDWLVGLRTRHLCAWRWAYEHRRGVLQPTEARHQWFCACLREQAGHVASSDSRVTGSRLSTAPQMGNPYP